MINLDRTVVKTYGTLLNSYSNHFVLEAFSGLFVGLLLTEVSRSELLTDCLYIVLVRSASVKYFIST
jgi:hypothetical protein